MMLKYCKERLHIVNLILISKHSGLFLADNPSGPALKHYLYSHMKDQPIWQSLRFWNAAFFDAVQRERARRPMPTR